MTASNYHSMNGQGATPVKASVRPLLLYMGMGMTVLGQVLGMRLFPLHLYGYAAVYAALLGAIGVGLGIGGIGNVVGVPGTVYSKR